MAPSSVGAPCGICGGTGIIRIDDLTCNRCSCNVVRTLRDRLGTKIAPAKPLRSPLYEPGSEWDKPKVDRTQDNLFIVNILWTEMLRHLKWVLVGKFRNNLAYRYNIISDERIKNVFVGNESAVRKGKDEKDRGETFDGLESLVGEHDLLIIQLGFLGHKNIAAAGALHEALMIREALNKPTWLVDHEESDRRFQYGYHAYSGELASYIENHFEKVDLGEPGTVPQPTPRVEPTISSDGEVLDEEARPSTDDASTEEDILRKFDLLVEDKQVKKSKWRPRGGGPV